MSNFYPRSTLCDGDDIEHSYDYDDPGSDFEDHVLARGPDCAQQRR